MSVDATREMVEKCIHEPVLSDRFDFTADEEADYNSMSWRGRDLYDNLRTQFSVGHDRALEIAVDTYGKKINS